MSLALVYLGKPQCNTNPADLKELNALLEAQKPFVKVYNSDGTVERQVSGETLMHEQWSGKALETRQQKPAFRYVYPKEGIIGWMDNVAVLKDAKNVDNAKLFQNFMMDPENAALISDFAGYDNGITGANKFLPPAFANSPEIKAPAGSPTPEFVEPCPKAVLEIYNKIWTNLRK